jgi:hypothetical protein
MGANSTVPDDRMLLAASTADPPIASAYLLSTAAPDDCAYEFEAG